MKTPLALAAMAASLSVLAADAPRLVVPADYRLVWSDEFETDGLPDPAKWDHDTGMNQAGWHNHELQYYSGPRAENAVVRGGRLVITARRESRSDQADWGGQHYSSARLTTHARHDWTYGFFDVRARLPCGKGSWPAIWMLNSALEWPAGGELDIMEHVGREPGRVFSTVHSTSGSGGQGRGAATRLKDVCQAFHDYQMLWTPEQVRFAIDGVVHFELANGHQGAAAWPFDKPQFLILNVAIGGDLGGKVDDRAFPMTMEIEHVRVYQRAPKGLSRR